MCSNTKWKGNYPLLGEAVGGADSLLHPMWRLCFSGAVLHLSCFISMALHPCLSHHIPHFCSSSGNGSSCYPLQIFASCLPCMSHQNLSSLLPTEKLCGQGGMAMELFSPRSTEKQDHRALVTWESLGAAGTGTDGSSAKPDWKILRQSSNPN